MDQCDWWDSCRVIGERMTKAAAGQFRAMDAAAKAAGLELHVNSGYRTYAEQAALYNGYLHHGGPLAAAPGHSTHGLGLSATSMSGMPGYSAGWNTTLTSTGSSAMCRRSGGTGPIVPADPRHGVGPRR
ncbi:MAG: hypothetical protein QOE61_5486 [Micromonosporaceae bacterium]|jgi:LAS superfamily LD-carboxypeptidase LdcB|nr:hypothetical protein [Micromonosporaceae bacterium]